uniref:Uncharacterized protein n=1 Tax=Phytophthora ramorum TaxID=164328 RepID=H3H7R8_PHYRM
MVSPTRPSTPGTSGSSTPTRPNTSGAPSTASLDRAAAAEPRSPVVPILSIALPHVDRGAARYLLDTFADLLDRADAQSNLEEDHANLQRAYVAQRERADRLEREIDAAYANASPYVLFCQRQYDILYRRCQDAQRLAADFECVVRERLDNSREIAAIRDRLRLEQDVHTEEIARLHAEIDSLTQQLAAAVTTAHENSSSELAQRMSAQQSELNRLVIEHDQAVLDRDRARQELAQTENNVQAYETSQRALEDAASRLRSQNTRLEQRVTNLQAQLRQQTLHVQHQLDRSHAERDRERDRANTAEATLQSTSAKLQNANAERDRARADLQTNRTFLLEMAVIVCSQN